MKNKCNHIFRSGPLFKGHVSGGASLGRCENECVYGLVVCLEHADKEALYLMINSLVRELEAKKK